MKRVGLCIFLMWMLLVPVWISAQDAAHELAYSNGDIYRVDTDSGLITQLTKTTAYETSPAWSPDGKQLAYTATLSEKFYGQYGLYVMDADGSHVQLIASDLMWRSRPVWLRDGETILYATNTQLEDGECVIKSINRDGSGAQERFRQAVSNCDPSYLNPVVSPDETQIVFGLDEKGDGKSVQLYRMSLADGQVTQLTHDRARNTAPQWSPDGTRIAYVSNPDNQEEIYVMNADGTNVQRVTHRRGRDYTPVWMPDGTHLIFGSDQGGYNNLLSVDLAAGTVQNLTNLTDSGAWSPELSPDGKQLVYSAGLDPVGGAEHMMIMELDMGKVRELAQVGDGAYSYMWRPQ